MARLLDEGIFFRTGYVHILTCIFVGFFQLARFLQDCLTCNLGTKFPWDALESSLGNMPIDLLTSNIPPVDAYLLDPQVEVLSTFAETSPT